MRQTNDIDTQLDSVDKFYKRNPELNVHNHMTQQSTVEERMTVHERLNEIIETYRKLEEKGHITSGAVSDNVNWAEIKLLLKLAEQKAREEERSSIMKYLNDNHIQYCINQNGLPYCKNCGLDLKEMELDLKKDN